MMAYLLIHTSTYVSFPRPVRITGNGSPRAGPKVAAILSIVKTCRRIQIPVREYLAAILPGLADVSIQKLVVVTPAAWADGNQ
jgi:hypothetical protein